MNVGQHRRWWWKEYTSKIYLNLSPWFFTWLYPGHLGFWPMGVDQYTDFSCIALKQTKAGPRSSGTPFLYFFNVLHYIILHYHAVLCCIYILICRYVMLCYFIMLCYRVVLCYVMLGAPAPQTNLCQCLFISGTRFPRKIQDVTCIISHRWIN